MVPSDEVDCLIWPCRKSSHLWALSEATFQALSSSYLSLLLSIIAFLSSSSSSVTILSCFKTRSWAMVSDWSCCLSWSYKGTTTCGLWDVWVQTFSLFWCCDCIMESCMLVNTSLRVPSLADLDSCSSDILSLKSIAFFCYSREIFWLAGVWRSLLERGYLFPTI